LIIIRAPAARYCVVNKADIQIYHIHAVRRTACFHSRDNRLKGVAAGAGVESEATLENGFLES
jgi:hypothetical protein